MALGTCRAPHLPPRAPIAPARLPLPKGHVTQQRSKGVWRACSSASVAHAHTFLSHRVCEITGACIGMGHFKNHKGFCEQPRPGGARNYAHSGAPASRLALARTGPAVALRRPGRPPPGGTSAVCRLHQCHPRSVRRRHPVRDPHAPGAGRLACRGGVVRRGGILT